MKTFMRCVLTFFAALVVLDCHGQTIKEGDDLQVEFNKATNHYFFKAPDFTSWPEGQGMLLIGAKPKPADCDYLFIALRDTTLIGVFVVKEPNYLLFDTAGNSTLSLRSEIFEMPIWVVKRRTKIDASDRTIVSFLDRLYESGLQSDTMKTDKDAYDRYQQYKTDTTLANRHIAFLFDEYQNITNEAAARQTPAGDVPVTIMKTLVQECESLYGQVPVIVCMYMGVALASAGRMDEARDYFKTSLRWYPNSVPLLVYDYTFEQDPVKKQVKLSELKKKCPKHWMVKDL